MIDRGIGDGHGTGKTAHLAQHNGTVGLVAYTEALKIASNAFVPALNDLNGGEMAVDASFGGTPVGIHNGTDNAYWTGSVLSGTWDFASTTNPDAPSPTLNPGTPSLLCIECVSNSSGDEALFSGGPVDFSNYTAISGRVRLEQWGGAEGTKDITAQFRLGGVAVGIAVKIDTFIDTGVLNAYQTFAINKENFSIDSESVDELVIQKNKSSGSTPKFRLDNIQFEETGGSVLYSIISPPHKKLIVTSLYISYIDALDISLLNNSAPALSYDKILGLAQLTNGITFQILEAGEIVSSVSTRSLGDNLKSGAAIESLICDGTNTCITLRVSFGGPLVLDSRYEDAINIIIGDDMTDLISVNMLASGKTEPVSAHRPEIREG